MFLYDWIFIGLFVIALIVSLIIGQTYDFKYPCEEYKKPYIKKRTTWLRANLTYYLVNNVCMIINFFCPAIVLYISAMRLDVLHSTERIIFYSIIGLLCQTLTYVLNPGKIAYGYREAYRTMENAIFETLLMPQNKAEPILINAAKIGEEYITNAMYLTFSLKGEDKDSINKDVNKSDY